MRSSSFQTLLGEGRSQLVVRRSRFLGLATPVRDEGHAACILDQVADSHSGATHVAFAFRVGRDRGVVVERYSDAGEPHGTAGQPLLELVRSQDLDLVLVSVVRHYGGVKLGTGGLARAYARAGRDALESAPRGARVLCRRFSAAVPYGLYGALAAHLPTRGWPVTDAEFGKEVSLSVWVPEAEVDAFTAYLGEAGGREMSIRDRGSSWLAMSDAGLEGDSCWTP